MSPEPRTSRSEPVLTLTAPLSAWKHIADVWYGESPAGGSHRNAEGLMGDIDEAVSRAENADEPKRAQDLMGRLERSLRHG